jgi:2,3-bisphosphoglycerate-dependent phosphoglycerate mutase
MSIILIRHGETVLNVARILQPADTPLSERGRHQAAAVAQRFSTAKIGAIVSSDLPRAVETAQAISSATGVAIRFSALLQERNFGELRGLAYDDLDFDAIAMEDAPPGGESMDAIRDRAHRAMGFLREIRATLEHDLLVVSHGFFIRRLLAEHVRMPENSAAPLRIDNTSVTIVSRDAPHLASLVNNTEHLTGDLRDDARGISGV